MLRQRHPGGSEMRALGVVALLRVAPLGQRHHEEDVVALVRAAHILAPVAARPCKSPRALNTSHSICMSAALTTPGCLADAMQPARTDASSILVRVLALHVSSPAQIAAGVTVYVALKLPSLRPHRAPIMEKAIMPATPTLTPNPWTMPRKPPRTDHGEGDRAGHAAERQGARGRGQAARARRRHALYELQRALRPAPHLCAARSLLVTCWKAFKSPRT